MRIKNGEGDRKMKRAILFFDIDGTLLSDETGKIPDSTLRALTEAKKNGHLLFINTGRTICALPKELYRFDFDGYLCGCGSYLVFHDEVLLEQHIEESLGRKYIEQMWECGLDGVLEGTEDLYFPKAVSRFEQLEQGRIYFGELGLGKKKYIEEGGFIYDKIFVYADEQSDKERFFRLMEEHFEVIDRGRNTYELAQKSFSKATACEYMVQKFGADRDDVYVFGDSMNDLSMFEYAVHTVAMEKHAPGLDPYTEFVTKTVEEGGVAWAMKHYGLI